MFCQNCNTEIPPAWKRMIIKNECPACGEPIMSEQSKQLLDELKEAMERMPNDPEGLAGWLLSNYRLQKIGDAQPTDFHGKRVSQANQQDVPNNLKTANNPIKEWLDRAGVSKDLEKRKNLQAIANYINSNAEEGEEEEVNAGQPLAKNVLENNSVFMPGDDSPPMSPHEMSAIAEALSKEELDPDNIPKALQAARMQKLQNQKAALNGGGKGSFRRG